MTEFEAIRIACSSRAEFSRSFGTVCRSLPREMGIRLRDILANYFARFGMEGAYERINNRTVAQIFAEYDGAEAKPIASGEVDGVRYALFDAPSGDDTNPTPKTDTNERPAK